VRARELSLSRVERGFWGPKGQENLAQVLFLFSVN
jgi:hypothetical protein